MLFKPLVAASLTLLSIVMGHDAYEEEYVS